MKRYLVSLILVAFSPSLLFGMSDSVVSGPGQVIDVEVYFPLLWHPSYSNVEDKVTYREIGPATGRYTGNIRTIDSSVGGPHHQGPEIGRDSSGYHVFYRRKVNGVVNIWRTVTNLFNPPANIQVKPVTTSTSVGYQLSAVSKSCKASNIGLLYSKLVNGSESMFYGFASNLAGTETPFPYKRRGNRPVWLPDTFSFVYHGHVAKNSKQLVLVDAVTKRSTIITNELGEIIEANAFKAPEYNNEVLIAAVIDNLKINIYRRPTSGTLWTIVQAHVLPAPWQPFAVEVIEGDDNKCLAQPSKVGRSFLVVNAAKTSLGKVIDQSIWLLSPFDGFLQRVDVGNLTGAAAGRQDAELWLVRDPLRKVDELYVRYQEKDARTGSRARSVKTGFVFPY